MINGQNEGVKLLLPFFLGTMWLACVPVTLEYGNHNKWRGHCATGISDNKNGKPKLGEPGSCMDSFATFVVRENFQRKCNALYVCPRVMFLCFERKNEWMKEQKLPFSFLHINHWLVFLHLLWSGSWNNFKRQFTIISRFIVLDIYGRWIVIDNSIIDIYGVQDSSWSSHFLHLLRCDRWTALDWNDSPPGLNWSTNRVIKLCDLIPWQ